MKSRLNPILAMWLSLGLFVGGCNTKNSPEEHLSQGKELLAKGDRRGAIVEFKNTLQAQPANVEARLLLGQAYLANKAYADAEKELQQARERGAPEDQVIPYLAKALLGDGEAQKVIDLGIPTHTYSPQSRAALYATRASAQFGLGKQTEAEQSIAAAEEADPNHPELLLLKARLALSKQDKSQAMRFLESILKQNAKFTDALYLKAALLQQDGNIDEATKTLRQIIAGDSKEFRAHLAIAGLLMQNGDMEGADKSIQAAETVAGKEPMVKYARGTLELQRGKLDKASNALMEVLRVTPNHLPSMLAYAMASHGLGHYDQSISIAGKVLGAVPDNLIAARILASGQIKIGDIKGALKTLDPFLSKHPKDARLLALAGEAHLQARDYNKSQGYLDKAAELEPENAEIRTRRAAGHLAAGDSGEALAEFQQAAHLSDKAGQADLALVVMQLQKGQHDKALEAIANLERKLPKNPLTQNLRAAALMGKQDQAGARRALEQALAIQPGFFPAAINLARMDMKENNPQAARKRFEAILAVDKGNLNAMLALADLAAAARQEQEVLSWLEKAVKAHPDVLAPRQRLIQHYLGKKDNRKALSSAKEAASAIQDSAEAIHLLGVTQAQAGDMKGAIETFTRLTEKARNSPDAYLRLAMAQAADKQLAPARASLERALQIEPRHVRSQDALLRLELAENKLDAALRIARQIQAQSPKSPLGFDREADILLAQKRVPQAVKAYELALSRGGGAGTLVKLYRAMSQTGDNKGAEQKLKAWLQAHPDDLNVRLFAAEQYLAGNRNREAIALYEEILRKSPAQVVALNNLATLYQKEKDKRALATAEQALKLAPGQPGIQDTVGWILVEQGQLPRALELLRAAADKAPRSASIRYHYAVALARSGKRTEAKRELEAALGGGQNFPEREDAKSLLKGL